MGLRFRKSKKIGPFRFTLSKSGISTSFGVKGTRITRTAGGKTRFTASVPGTGISWSEEIGGARKSSAAKTQRETGEKRMDKKTKWIIALAVLLGLGLLGGGGGKKTTYEQFTPEPAEETIQLRTAPTPDPFENAETEFFIEMVEPAETEPTPYVEQTYVKNINTGVVHSPNCRYAKQIKPENRLEFTCTRDEFYAGGYNLCDYCLR